MSKGSFGWGSAQSSKGLPAFGTMRNGACSARPRWEPRIDVRGSSCSRDWQTPAVFQGKYRRQARQTTREEELLPAQAENWQTPTRVDSTWRDYTYPSGDHEHPFPSLVGQAQEWGTPTAHERTQSPRDVDHGNQLANQADAWPTPRTSDTNGPGQHGDGGKDLRTTASLFGLPAPATPTGGSGSSPRGQTSPPPSKKRLNPRFVEALMNLPPGWTDFAPVGTAFSRWWQLWRSEFLRIVSR